MTQQKLLIGSLIMTSFFASAFFILNTKPKNVEASLETVAVTVPTIDVKKCSCGGAEGCGCQKDGQDCGCGGSCQTKVDKPAGCGCGKK